MARATSGAAARASRNRLEDDELAPLILNGAFSGVGDTHCATHARVCSEPLLVRRRAA